MEPIVLAYSGGPQSSGAIGWLASTYGAEIVALTLDIGQGGDLEQVRDRALAAGAIRAHVLDVRDEFARDYMIRALKAGALYRDGRSLATVLGRPLIARRLVEIAAIEQTTTVAHASAADGARMAAAVAALDPRLTVVVPPHGGGGAGTGAARSLGECPDEPAYVELTFEAGVPSALNGIAMPLLDLIGSLDILAGAHGVGRLSGLETPAARVLASAHAQLVATVVGTDTARVSDLVTREYAAVIDRGSWFAPLRRALDAFVDAVQLAVAGRVRLKLFKRECTIVDTQAAAPRQDAAPAKKLTYIAAAKA